MAFYDIAVLSQDPDFLYRCTACYATQSEHINPNAWVSEHTWDLAGAPGFGDAYASAIAGGVENPGRDQAVISDEQILAAVQAEIAGQPPLNDGTTGNP